MTKKDEDLELAVTALKLGMMLIAEDVQVRIETLERKLGLPVDKSLGLDQRLARIEDEILRRFPD